MIRSSSALLLSSLLLAAAPAHANPAAALACMDNGVIDPSPRYLGRTPGGMPVYLCRDLLSSPPFPIVACSSSISCERVGSTY